MNGLNRYGHEKGFNTKFTVETKEFFFKQIDKLFLNIKNGIFKHFNLQINFNIKHSVIVFMRKIFKHSNLFAENTWS